MSGKPGIPEWQRASSSSTASTASTNDTTSSQKPEEEDEASAQQQPQQPPVEAPTPTEDDVAQLEEEQQASENSSLLEQAARFLDDPTIRDAPREKKVTFLESKGVSAEDIGRLLGEEEPESRLVKVEDVGERAWSTTPPKPAHVPEDQIQPREIPPIVTYPEFLASTEKPPPLITTERLAATAYIAGGFMASMYGLSKYIIAPMTHGLAESRRDFASHTNEQLKELNERLRKSVSVDPASKVKPIEDGADNVSEADSDPTELYHRDYGTQTTPNLSRRPSTSTDPHPTVTAQENRLKIIKSHLQELESHRAGQGTSRDRLRTKISDLTTYLTDMDYQNQYYPAMGRYGATFNWTGSSQESKNDQIEVLKGDIRAVKGVFLSARNFPTGGMSATPIPTGRIFSGICWSRWASKLSSLGHSKSEDKDETSLTTLLDAEQCAELTFLIATITASMRKSLVKTFTAKEFPIDEKTAKSEEEALRDAPSDLDNVDVEKEDKIKKERQKREEEAKKELAKPEVQELKREMLRYFDDWRGQVVSRVGEVINSKDKARKQAQEVESQQTETITSKSEAGLTSIEKLDDKEEDEEKMFKSLYPPVPTNLTQLEESKRALVLHSLVLILLSLEHYSAHSRVLILYLTSSLGLGRDVLKKDEETVAQGLLEAASQQLNTDEETKKAAESSQKARRWKVGLAGVAGAALIGVTGGLAAPLLAAGIGSVMGGVGLGATAAAGYLGTLAGSSVLVGGLFGAYGAKMTGKAMDEYAREVEDFAFIPIHRTQDPKKQDNESRRLRVAIAISGWLRKPEEVSQPWRYISKGTEGFALRWELEALLKLGHSLETFITSAAWGYAKKKIIEQTVFAAMTAALWPLGLLKIATLLDNPFSVAKYRAEKAGEVLADALINKVQGERPVTLVGYSLGARLIFSCLQKLADRKAFGLIENVVLVGAPCPSDAEDWRRIRSVVSGRCVNVFSKNDYILGFLYRTSSVQLGVAGLQPVVGVHGVQNVEVSELVDGHLQYRFITGSILRKIGFEDVDIEEVERAEADLHKETKKVEEERRKNEGEKGEGGEDEEELKKQAEKKQEESLLAVMQQKTRNMDIGGFVKGWSGKAAPETAAKQQSGDYKDEDKRKHTE
ncbi:hypothetical protein COCC4DRAFT_184077 [Bipolaris maydis ATCC 48331]|uniref:Peroxisome membrane anchor protein Pex14p N-terminal domain-containing protein n=2 Tax=Cochliobolus heterostrophus TaxID=5016 RepID=M2V8F6_COCH5|nr:uncharacterized protein COCC4DRAFT_184077 [Bipolaris maydis ATCC 48331]EMD96013.1 hypothetical protein COCHEDRAFT_1127385 [Bipolaris maydis C5]ENI10871.1 hypothetical protein COCC4DRAFT_184077 [Bipolaris maydis ATCC 48331]KAJ6213206.1 hypothetical protein PSV09DRAFT_1127385 [Bipolaris maydis]